MIRLILLSMILSCTAWGYGQADNSSKTFQLFKWEEGSGGFGGFSINAFNGEELFLSGEGAYRVRNFYIGGFGYSFTQQNVMSANLQVGTYDLNRSSGGLVIGGYSNTSEFFAMYTALKIGFDSYSADIEMDSGALIQEDGHGYSILPEFGVAFTPLSYLQVKLFGGYTFSGRVDLPSVNDLPLNAGLFGVRINFGAF